MHSVAKPDLVSSVKFRQPVSQGDYFSIPATALTDTEQRVAESKWKVLKELEDNYKNVKTALTQLF